MPEDLAIPSMPLIMKRASIRGWPSGTAEDSRQTIQFALEQGVKCQIEKFPLEKANEAYEG
jgi:D-arabinose 1-dehydrogenase-like Zn-dependent alcohol dehydrogenase